MFWDEAIIKISGGKGGDGKVSFRHERGVPRGGPDGGDGGDGGSCYFEVDSNLNTLNNFNRSKNFRAEDGKPGEKKRKHGKNGQDLILKVPQGTVVYIIGKNTRERKVADLDKNKQTYLIARGGRGGWGNVHFATAIHQAPTMARLGQPGEERKIHLVLKLIADVGIFGIPNSGKSTLLARISAAKPKIANYPFTTLVPNLGVAKVAGKEIVFCDIPGLIEGSHAGRGLGDKFLRHIERCRILIHLLDATSSGPAKDFEKINSELKKYSPILASKKQIIALNKIDAVDKKTIQKIIQKFRAQKIKLWPISAFTGEGIKELLLEVKKQLK